MACVLPIVIAFLLGFPAAASAADVKLLECVTAPEAQERSATFEARARRKHGSERIQVRFTLQTRDPTHPDWRRVIAGGLHEWLTSDPGVRRYLYARTLRNLSAPAAYRVLVRFRWLDRDGVVLARSRATSRACRQPGERPNLTPVRIDVSRPRAAEPATYAVALRNRGGAPAGPFSVTLRAGELELAAAGVPGLAPRERWTVTFTGPACKEGEPLIATVDPDLTVEEDDEHDNVLVAACLPGRPERP